MLGPLSQSFNCDLTNINRTFNLYGEGKRGFKQKKLIKHFFCPNHSGTHKDISVQIIDHCDPNDQERREDFSIYHLDTMFPKGLNQKKLLRYN